MTHRRYKFFLQRHPELQELYDNPNDVAKEEMTNVFTGKKYLGTNKELLEQKHHVFKIRELPNDKDYKKAMKDYQNGQKHQQKIDSLRHKIKKFEKIRELFLSEPVILESKTVYVLESLLKKAFDRKRKNGDSKSGFGDSFLIPYTVNKENDHYVKIFEKRKGFLSNMWFLETPKRELICTIDNKGIAKFRIPEHKDPILRELSMLAADPKLYFSTKGKRLGICLLCGKKLSDAESVKNGFGPVCAKNYVL